MAKINKYWGYVAIGALTAAAAGAVAALIAKKGSCKEDFDFEFPVLGTYRRTVCNR